MKNSIFTSLQNNHGFSLTEVMMAAGIMAIVVASSGLMLVETLKSQARTEAKYETMQLAQNITHALTGSVQSCQRTVAGQNFDAGQAATADGMSLTLTVPQGDTTLLVAQDQELADFNLRVEDLSLANAENIGIDPATGHLVYQTTIKGRFLSTRPMGSMRNAAPIILASAFVLVDGGTGQISGCKALDVAGGDGLEDVCTALGGRWDNNLNQCLPPENPVDICGQLGGTYTNGRCFAMPNLNQLCQDLGLEWRGGRCQGVVRTITSARNAGGGDCTMTPPTEGPPEPAATPYREGSQAREEPHENGWYNIYTCIGGGWVRTGSYHH